MDDMHAILPETSCCFKQNSRVVQAKFPKATIWQKTKGRSIGVYALKNSLKRSISIINFNDGAVALNDMLPFR